MLVSIFFFTHIAEVLYRRKTFTIVNLNCILYISDNVEMDEAVEAWTNRPFLFMLIQNMQIRISVDTVEDMSDAPGWVLAK